MTRLTTSKLRVFGEYRTKDGQRLNASRSENPNMLFVEITAVSDPQLVAVDDNQTPSDALASAFSQTSNYESSLSSDSIETVDVTFLVNDAEVLSTHDLVAGDVLKVRIIVTSRLGATEEFDAGQVTVDAAPV